ncbi:primosome assembly protein PriA [Pseudomonas luteola]|uniref:Primosome assembly protein PriA n=1 Tax=Pseudomonas luteola TaxID=47886 RepID=A0A2X2E4B1_PSELU|nr:primosome assembly protein PriA [Pseudomonas luteola]
MPPPGVIAEYRTDNRPRIITEAYDDASRYVYQWSANICLFLPPSPDVSEVLLRLALPSPLRRLFDYRAPAGVDASELIPGVRLRVPFGRREIVGILVQIVSETDVPRDKLKPAIALLDTTPQCRPA